MKFITSVILCISIITLSFAQEKPFAPQQLLVQLQPNTDITDFQNELSMAGLQQTDMSLLSKNMNIYLLVWPDAAINNYQAMDKVISCRGVINLQNNHFIKERETIPTDPSFANTWHHKNTGQTGGTADNDIDTPDAWDITTGGVTESGDTIVVCILEGGGGNLSHPDIVDNIYVNIHEIPNNNIDDDGNGYVDDINGWNVNANQDSHATGNHGTQVMGMIGASANNGIGSTGVNHDVKMMLISGFNMNESSVIAAYDYPLTQRKLYNQTGGINGAFVVATNASWGIDGADPANYPLWCAYYDTLGIHGILNCGATTNQNFNVDAGGDMPTACGSDYMISVTASNHNDQRTFSGYGANTIDLAAPGENVLLPSGSNSYGTTSGTSFASPCVAGAIALAYSTPCSSFSTLYASNPQSGADYVRLALLNSVDPVPSLANECVTGGRMNVNQFILQILGNCGNTCLEPYTQTLDTIVNNVANFSIGTFSNDNRIYYQLLGATTWDSLSFTGNTVSLANLDLCSEYRVRFSSICNGNISPYSDTLYFTSEGCCTSPLTQLNVQGANAVNLSWDNVFVGTAYNLQYSVEGANNWTTAQNITSPYTLTNLDSCTVYEIQMQTICADSSSAFSSSTLVETNGCGSCTEVDYCLVDNGDTQYEWIEKVVIGSLNLTTGDNDGYKPTQNTGVDLFLGNSYNFSVQPGFSGAAYTDKFLVWIDFNQDGIFEDTELVIDASSNSTVTENVSIPSTATLGRTRVRFMIFGSSSTPTACFPNNFWGEVEDYCVTLRSDVGMDEIELNEQIVLAPNPSQTDFFLLGLPQNAHLSIYGIQGNLVVEINNYKGGDKIDISLLQKGVYFVEINVNGKRVTKKLIKK